MSSSAAIPRRLMRLVSGVAVALALASIAAVALAMLVLPVTGFDRHLVDAEAMSPAMPRGSITLERRVSVSELKKNDVITFQRAGADRPVTRRIVSTDRDRLGRRVFWTKGDAEARPDARPVHLESAEQPRVSFHVPYAGWPLIALGDPGLRLILLGGLAFAVVAALASLAGRRDPALTTASHRA